jgi:hypothetical protein
LTPDEVCEALVAIGANVSRRTLLHYEEAQLIPKPDRGGGGRKGRYTNYPDWTVEEAFAAWSLIHGKYKEDAGEDLKDLFEGMPSFSPSKIRKIRDSHYGSGDGLPPSIIQAINDKHYGYEGEQAIRTKKELVKDHKESAKISEIAEERLKETGTPKPEEYSAREAHEILQRVYIEARTSITKGVTEDAEDIEETEDVLIPEGADISVINKYKEIYIRMLCNRVTGLKKINFGYQLLWEAECLRARILLISKYPRLGEYW